MLDETVFISIPGNALRKGMNYLCSPSYGQIVRWTGFFSFSKATSLGEVSLWIHTSFTSILKIDFFSHPIRSKMSE